MEKDDDGRFSETRTDREVLDAVAEHTPAGTAEVAGTLDVTRQAADYRLRRLREEERVRSKKVGGSLIWIAVEEPTEEIDVEPDTDTRREPTTPDTDGEDDTDELVEAVRRFLEDRPPHTDHAKEALVEVFRVLREDRAAKTGELKEAVYSAFGDHYGSERAAWESVSRYLEDVPGVAKGGYGSWEYVGDDVAREELE